MNKMMLFLKFSCQNVVMIDLGIVLRHYTVQQYPYYVPYSVIPMLCTLPSNTNVMYLNLIQ